jgi:hypothetical protein
MMWICVPIGYSVKLHNLQLFCAIMKKTSMHREYGKSGEEMYWPTEGKILHPPGQTA